MQIHELNNFTGTLGSGAYLAIDDGNDTGKISSQGLLAATEARIDNIIAGPAPSAEEIVDARLGADGVTYPSLGDAIRDQFTDVKSALYYATGNEALNFSDPALKQYIVTNGSTVQWDNPSTSSSTQIKWSVTPCSAGDVFVINGKGGNADRLWAFADASKNILTREASGATRENWVIVAPTNAAYLIVNDESDKQSYSGLPLVYKFDEFKDETVYYRNAITNMNNILNRYGTRYVANKYYYNGGYTSNDSYSTFEFQVESGKSYTIGCRFRFMCKITTNLVTSETPAGYVYTADETTTIYLSVFNTDASSWIVIDQNGSIANSLPYSQYGLNPNIISQESGNNPNKIMSQKAVTDAINGASTLPYYEQYKGNDQSYTLGTANSIKKNKVINFGCDFSTFGTLYIDLIFGTGNSIENRFAIDSTNLVRTVDGSVKPAVAHGITIQDHINVTVEVLITGIKLTIVSNGQSYSAAYNYANGSVRPSYSVSGMTISNVDFSWTCKDFKKDMWLFGDSYFSYGTNRWIYYLSEDGYADNCLIDGYPGEGSNYSLPSLQSYIDLAKPQNIVWCVGMNDGGDTSSAPSTQWKNAVDTVISICEEKGINLILATIPTVPSINHEKKNEFVRSSGYQYIDFAKAVGASSSGVWFDGMLATDNVHPTVAGAMALYRQALLDCPQLMISN